MTNAEVIEKLRGIYEGKTVINAQKITPEMKVFKDLGLDSLTAADFIIQIEDDFGFEFDEEDLVKIVEVSDLIELIKSSSE
jgi:acyl carrier protein